jgi:hypothetical protein
MTLRLTCMERVMCTSVHVRVYIMYLYEYHIDSRRMPVSTSWHRQIARPRADFHGFPRADAVTAKQGGFVHGQPYMRSGRASMALSA